MRRGHGEVEEEGLLLSLAFANVFGTAAAILQQDLGEVPVGDSGPGGYANHCAPLHLGSELANQVFIFTPRIRRPVGHIIAKVVIKAVTVRPALDGLGEVDFGQFFGESTSLPGPIPPEVPLADHAGRIALRAEHFRQGLAGIGNQRSFPLPDDAALEATAPVVASGEHTVACRRADTGSRMGIHEGYSLAGQLIDGGCLQTHPGVECGYRVNAHVITEDEDDIGGSGQGRSIGHKQSERQEGCEGRRHAEQRTGLILFHCQGFPKVSPV